MDRQKIERSIKGLSEWQMHVQAKSDIDTNISTAIEALKAQLSREGTTSDQPVATDTNIGDTISRQVAIDRFNVIRPVDPKKDEYTKGIDVGIAMCIVAVKDQPTIQPVATDTNVGDTISRQQAIDALMDAVKKVGILDADDIKAVFDMLPIIQPVATDTNVGNNSEIPNSSDCISRQAAIDIERNATVDTNPSHFEAHQKFTQFMDDAEVSSFGRWQWANGFNTALTAVGIDLKKLPPAQPDLDEWCTDCREYDKDRHSCPRWNRVIRQTVEDMKAAQPELTDEQAITHLQSSGWMQRHDKEMYESGLREQLADDSDSYDSLLQSVQSDLIEKIQAGITATNLNDAYSLGMRNGMRWCKSLIDGAEPQFEDVTDTAELLSAQHEPQEGHWIPHESPDGGVQYECSECGVLWEFNDGTPEDNEAYFCPKCGKKLITK